MIATNTLCASCAFLLLIGSTSAVAKGSRITGLMFGDYYWVVSDTSRGYKEANSPVYKDNAIQFRRIYFTYEDEIAADFTVRLRREVHNATLGVGGKMDPFVKHAYLKWRGLVPNSSVYVGLSGASNWAVSEGIWGYRSVEKTIQDLHGIGTSADIGFALKGSIDSESKVNYQVKEEA